jgi:hypothetical protein
VVLIVDDEGVMDLPHKEFIGDESSNKVEEATPGLMPFIEHEF